MSTNTQERRFAFNHNTVDGCPCPAFAAGYNPNNDSIVCEIAEQYDERAYTFAARDSGTLPEHNARQAWDQTIELLKDRSDNAETERIADHYHEMVKLANEIADELGW